MFGRHLFIRDCLKATITAVFLTATVGTICKVSTAQPPGGGTSTTPYWEVVETRTGEYFSSRSDWQTQTTLPYANPQNANNAFSGDKCVVTSTNTVKAAINTGNHKFTFTWKSGTSNVPVPKSVIVKLDAMTNWRVPTAISAINQHCTVTGGTGLPAPTVNEVVADAPVSGGTGHQGSTRKAWYAIKHDPPATFDISVAVSAEANATGSSNTDSQGSIEVGSSVFASISSVNMNLLETTKDNLGKQNILIGQGCSANLIIVDNGKKRSTSSGGYGGSTPNLTPLIGAGVTLDPNGYQWTVSGFIFDRFQIGQNASTGRAISCEEADSGGTDRFKKPNPRRWIWKQALSDATVTGSTNLLLSGNSIGTFEETKVVIVQKPSSSYIGTPGPIFLDYGILGAGERDANGKRVRRNASGQLDPSGESVVGILYTGTVTTPSLFRRVAGVSLGGQDINGTDGAGFWASVQRLTISRKIIKSNGSWNIPTSNGLQSLDECFPYGFGYTHGSAFLPFYTPPELDGQFHSATGLPDYEFDSPW
jgi:hypothetical protein